MIHMLCIRNQQIQILLLAIIGCWGRNTVILMWHTEAYLTQIVIFQAAKFYLENFWVS